NLSHSLIHHPPPIYIYTLSLHDALPISSSDHPVGAEPGDLRGRVAKLAEHIAGVVAQVGTWRPDGWRRVGHLDGVADDVQPSPRSEEHTSELQSLTNLVCRLLLEKKKDS